MQPKENYVSIMKSLEPVFFEAADLVCAMQQNVKGSSKNDGPHEISIVTEADLAVQEHILQAVLRTELKGCHLLAEEKTPCVSKFTGELNLYLTLDPIDGTSNYAFGKPYFAIIIGLRSETELLYTFYHMPCFGWTHIMSGDFAQSIGKAPKMELPELLKKTVVYSFGENTVSNDDELMTVLAERGLQVRQRKEISPDILIGSTALFLGGFSAGYYGPNPLCVDGLVCLHYAKIKKLPIYSKGPNGNFDFSLIEEKTTGDFHPGYYLVLRK